MTVTFRRSFCAAHRIWNDDSACQRIHGHNYRVKIDIELTRDSSYELTEQGFVVPFDKVKAVVDALDHRLLLHEGDPLLPAIELAGVDVLTMADLPSTENLAAALAHQVRALLRGDDTDVWVTVELAETDSITATAIA